MPHDPVVLPPRFLRTKEAATYLSLSARTLEKHRTYTKARVIRDVLLSCDISMYVMCMAGTALSDTQSAQFAKTVPENRLIGTWSCQDLVTLDICPGQGARPLKGRVAPPDLPGVGVVPDEALIGRLVAIIG